MAKSFKDVVLESPIRTGLGIPTKTKNLLSRTHNTARGTAFRL